MRVLLQRVSSAAVSVDGREIARIGPGLLLLVGIGAGDTETDLAWMARKVASLRIFADGAGKMNLDVRQTGGAALSVSQFTLYGDSRRGTRPSFDAAEKPDAARAAWERFNGLLRDAGVAVSTGAFGADMKVDLTNDGPVTLWLESPRPSTEKGCAATGNEEQ